MRIQKFIQKEERKDGKIYYKGFVRLYFNFLGLKIYWSRLNLVNNFNENPVITQDNYATLFYDYRTAKSNLDNAVETFIKNNKRNTVNKIEIEKVC